jgi:hypothetical protein
MVPTPASLGDSTQIIIYAWTGQIVGFMVVCSSSGLLIQGKQKMAAMVIVAGLKKNRSARPLATTKRFIRMPKAADLNRQHQA